MFKKINKLMLIFGQMLINLTIEKSNVTTKKDKASTLLTTFGWICHSNSHGLHMHLKFTPNEHYLVHYELSLRLFFIIMKKNYVFKFGPLTDSRHGSLLSNLIFAFGLPYKLVAGRRSQNSKLPSSLRHLQKSSNR